MEETNQELNKKDRKLARVDISHLDPKTYTLCVGDIVMITKSPENWVPAMDKYHGALVQISRENLAPTQPTPVFTKWGYSFCSRDNHYTLLSGLKNLILETDEIIKLLNNFLTKFII